MLINEKEALDVLLKEPLRFCVRESKLCKYYSEHFAKLGCCDGCVYRLLGGVNCILNMMENCGSCDCSDLATAPDVVELADTLVSKTSG